MKRGISLFLVFLMILALSNCASIMRDGIQKISIESSSDSANVTIFDTEGTEVFTSETPAVVELKSGNGYFQKASYQVVVEKAGYEKFEFQIEGSFDVGWYSLGNIFFGGLIGWLIVDPISGAMWVLEPEKIDVELSENTALLQKEKGLVIVLKEEISEDLLALATAVR